MDAHAVTMSDVIPSEPPDLSDLRPPTFGEDQIDLSLIEASLKLTPWERILANDDTVNFIDMAREAMASGHAAS